VVVEVEEDRSLEVEVVGIQSQAVEVEEPRGIPSLAQIRLVRVLLLL
jgi:hypothetical protein